VASRAGGLDRGADGNFDKRTSSHFVLYQDVDIDRTSGLRGSRKFEQTVLEVLESAYRQVDAYLGLRPDRPIVVVVYDRAAFDAQFSGLFKFPAAGFYGGRVHIRGDIVVTNQLVSVLHHELVHAAFDQIAPASVFVPAWLNEGSAEWLAMRAMGQRRLHSAHRGMLVQAAAGGHLFSLADMSQNSFGHLGPQGAALAYRQSHGFIEYIERVHGERALRALIDAYLRSGDFERAVRRTLRSDAARLEARWHEDLLQDVR
jgi:hypothetical protein